MRALTTEYELGERAKLVICFDYDKGDPGCHTQRNGDPGWPEVDPSVEITDVQVWVRANHESIWIKTPASLQEEVTNQEFLEDRAWYCVQELLDNEAAAREFE